MSARLPLAAWTCAAVILASPVASAGARFEATSVTSIQLKQGLDRAMRLPLVEDISAAFAVDLPGPNLLSGTALLKLGTVIGQEGGDLDLYLLSLQWHRARRSLRLVGGRQLLVTPAGLRIVDGVSLRLRPTRSLTLNAAAGWLRDTERDDLRGGALLVQGGASVSALPGTDASLLLSLRAGPDTSPRLDGRFSADAVLAAPLAPHPWIDGSFRIDEVGLRRLRGGIVLAPSPRLDVEIKGRVVRATDEDGTMSERILTDLASSPVVTLGAAATLRAPIRLSAHFGYGLSRYDVNPDYAATGHGIDASVRWTPSKAALEASYTLRTSYGGVFHGVGLRATLAPHAALRFGVAGQVAPYQKATAAWRLAQWWLAEVSLLPPSPMPTEFKIGGEYRAGAVLAHDVRVNASFLVHLAARSER